MWSGAPRATFIVATALWASAAMAAEPWRADRLWVVGSDSAVWVVGKSAPVAGDYPIVQIWRGADGKGGSIQPRPSPRLTPVSGDALLVGADADAMRILFADLTQTDYSAARGAIPGPSWREQASAAPVAWAGDSTRGVLLAVVEARSLIAPTTNPVDVSEKGEAATDTPGESPVAAASATQPAIRTRHALLRLVDGFWSRHSCPPETDEAEQLWLAGRDGQAYLFWAGRSGGISLSIWADSSWSRIESFEVGEVESGWAGAWSKGPVFVAGALMDQGRIQLTTHLRLDGKWSAERVREGNEWLQIDPEHSAVGVARGQLCIARTAGEGAVEFGAGDLGVSPDMRFTAIEMRAAVEPIEPGWIEAISLALLLGLLTLAMWSRREQITQAPVLPEGFMIAALWKRLIGTLIDAIPAVMVLSIWIFTHMDEFPVTTSLAELMQAASEDPALRAKVIPLNFATIAAYAIWCLVWELILGTSPGKLVFGCRVVHKSGGPARAGQIVVRNVIRAVMVGLGTPGWIVTILTMVIVSRCRQRMGDLLANTIVVEPGTPPEPIVDEPTDDWTRGTGE